jgi:lipopolysaccharide exporter
VHPHPPAWRPQRRTTATSVTVEHEVVAGPGDVPAATDVANGTRWTIAAMLARQFGRLGFSVVLARLLGPVDFGVIAAATVYITLTAVLLETGLATGIVQKPDLRPQDEGAGFWAVTGVGALISALTVCFAGPISDFLAVPSLRPVLLVLATGPLLKGVTMVSVTRLQRALRYRVMAVAEIVATLIGGAFGILAAELGAHYWSLVVQQVSTDMLCLVLWFAAAGLPSLRADREAFRHIRRFGLPLLGSQVFGYAGRNVDNVIVSHFLGPLSLSFYMIPYRIMLVPVSLLGNVTNRVAFPIFCRIQGEPERVRAFFLRSTRLVAVLAMPGMLAVSVLAPELVNTVFGPSWAPAAPVVAALAPAGILGALTTPGGSVFMGLGRADLAYRWSWIPLVAYVPAFFAGLPWHVVGIAWAYSIATALLTPFQIRAIGGIAAFGLPDWLRAVRPTVLAAVPAAALGLAVHLVGRGAGWPDPLTLLIGLAGVAGLYLVLLRLVDRPLFADAVRTGRLLAGGRRGAVVA